jgi:predicted nuclease of predicted toxin-antitoxin system
MRFLADMGISQRVASWLRQQGHDVAHLVDRNLQQAPDADVFPSRQRKIESF